MVKHRLRLRLLVKALLYLPSPHQRHPRASLVVPVGMVEVRKKTNQTFTSRKVTQTYKMSSYATEILGGEKSLEIT